LTTFHKFQVVELLVCHSGFEPFLLPVLYSLEIVVVAGCCSLGFVVVENLAVDGKLGFDCLPTGYMPVGCYIAELDLDLGFGFDLGSDIDLGSDLYNFYFSPGIHNRHPLQFHLVHCRPGFQFGGQPRS